MTKPLKKKLLIVIIALVLGLGFFHYGRGIWHPVYLKHKGKRSVSEVVGKYGNAARTRLKPYFENAAMAYPPENAVLVGIKDEKRLEVWAETDGIRKFVRGYPIQAASGKAGPKLREGDRQVPEGIYRIVGLNPNSSYHLSMKLDYPNAFDLRHAEAEGRTEPGTNIFIHGKTVSIGCLAMGDEAIEELFMLVHDVGMENVKVIIAPYDFRRKPPEYAHDKEIPWLPELYREIGKALSEFDNILTVR